MLKDVYKVIFNHFVNKEGYHASTEILAAILVGLIILFYLISIFCGILLASNSQILHHANTNKAYAFIFPIIFFAAIYILLFHVIKLPRHGDKANKYLFLVDKNTVFLVWTYITIGLVLFGLSLFATIKYLKP